MDRSLGNAGNDVFAHGATSESGFGVTRADVLLDFLSGEDLIDLGTSSAKCPAV